MITQIFIALVVCFVELQLAACCAYGPGCRFPCRCKTGGCDAVTGTCLSGPCANTHPNNTDFELGWRGPGCRIGNIAYNKVTSQSGVYDGHTSDRAVDGNTNPELERGNSCAHPKTGGEAWWKVDLGKLHIIEKIIIFFRTDALGVDGRDTNFYIRIGNNADISQQSLCKDYTGNRQAILQITCAPDVRAGQYVSMQRRADGFHSHLISICEFVVDGYEPIECGGKCSDSCDDLKGCNTCAPGFKLPDCIDECDPGTWGENCREQCGPCAGSQPCNMTDGECTNGCERGFWDTMCSSSCGQCLNNGTCDQNNSECQDKCEQWYLPSTCTVYIDEPTLVPANITTAVLSSSIMMVSWEQYEGVKDGLETYYNYKVVYGPTGTNTTSSVNVTHAFTIKYLSIELNGLIHNTEYEVKVVPYRVMGDMESAGSSTSVIRTKTDCREPETPTLSVINQGSAWQLQVKRLDELDSGCDSFSSYYLYMSSPDVDNQTMLQNRSVWNENVITIQHKESLNGTTIWVAVVNNDGKTQSSEVKQLIYSIQTTPSIITTLEVTSTDSGGFKEEQNEPNPPLSLTAGAAASALVVLVVVGVVIFIVVRRRRSSKAKTPHCDQILDSSSNLVMKEGVSPGIENVYANADDIAFPSTCVKVSLLEAYIQHKKEEVDGFQHEYSSISSGYVYPVTRASESKTISKNRFKNIRAYDKSRVVLEVEDDEKFTDYINACFIPGYSGDGRHYIAGQGPLPHTVSDHWRMIWQYNVTRIVMVTKEVELGKRKCERYWPDSVGDKKEFGPFTVTLREVEVYADFTIRKLECSKLNESKNVTLFHFTSWPDKQALEEAWPLLQFKHKVKTYPKIGPLFVHCSAGIGRTGTYIAIDYLIEQGLAEDKVDVHQCVINMREYRMNMVQTLAQYEFIYKAVLEAFTFGYTMIPCADVDVKVSSKMSQVAKQYQDIAKVANSLNTNTTKLDGQLEENKKKNRNPDMIPTDAYRPNLKTPWKGTNGYINAVYVNSYSRLKAFIVTQFPLANTVVDFWRLVYDHNCGLIVSLGVDDTKPEPQCAEAVYANCEEKITILPQTEGKPEAYGPFEVTITQKSREACFTSRNMIVQISGCDHKVDTTHIEMREWADGELPDVDTFMEVIKQVEQLKLENEGPVIVSCLNGSDKSGVLVTALYMTEYMKLEQLLDVATAVRCVRKYRKQFVSNQEQYEYLYKVAQSYNKMFSTYANYL